MDEPLLIGLLILLALATLVLGVTCVGLRLRMQQAVRQELRRWQEGELNELREQLRRAALTEAQAQLQAWQANAEAGIRADAVDRSRAVVSGKVTEHLAPYFPGFPYDPRDARFLGSPVDLVVFDGLNAGSLCEIVFVEIKTGSGQLSAREKQLRDVVRNRTISWRELRVA